MRLSSWPGAPRRGSQRRFSQGGGGGGTETHVRYYIPWPGLQVEGAPRPGNVTWATWVYGSDWLVATGMVGPGWH